MASKQTKQQLQESLEYCENIVSTIREPLLVLDADLRVISANRSFYRQFSVTSQEIEGKLIYEICNGQWNVPKLRGLLEDILPQNTSLDDFELDHEFPGLGRRSMLLNARRIHDGVSKEQKILLAIEDITDRKRVEHEMVSSELRYRRLFETAQDGILILNAQSGEITDANPFLLNMVGYSLEDLLGKKLWEIGFFKDSKASRQAFQVLQSKGYVRYEDLPLETKDGQAIEVEFVSNSYAIDGEKVIQCNIRDITVRKRVEQGLEKSRSRMANILSSISDGFFALDSDFTVTYFNQAAEQMLGRAASVVLNRHLFEAFPEAKGSIFEENYTRVLKEKKPCYFETYFGVKPFENWYDVRAFPSEDGMVVFFQVTTERKKAEAEISHLASFPELNPNPVLEFDQSGIIVYVNPAGKTRFLDLMVLGRKHPFLIDLDIMMEKTGINSFARDIHVRDFWYEQRLAYAVPTKTYRLYVRDITARKKVEEELRQRSSELEASNKELEAFSYSVSHDLRAPLRSMAGFSSALLEDYADNLDEQGKQYLKKIQDSSELMGQLMDGLLKLSRVTRKDLSYENVNLSDMAKMVLAELEKSEPKREVQVKIAPDIIVYGDRNLLRLAIENLLSNAWKFSSKVAEPQIEMGMVDHDGKKAYFVRDNGVGFDMIYANKLFQPFQRLHMASDFPGTGIGLATVQRVVRRHGGEIWVDAKVGEGTTFYFTLN
jgi:PAS domain S-box-containing protein